MKAVVVTLSGLHLGYLGCYGNQWIATPTLDRVAAEGVVFDHHYADAADAEGARRAWRSGRYEMPRPEAVRPAATDLLALLREHGVLTVLVTDGNTHDFHAGWDHVVATPFGSERMLGSTVNMALESWRRLRQEK